MIIEINRKLMLEAAKSVAKIAPSNSNVDVLNGILVEGNDNTGAVYMTGTNLEVSIQHKIIASVGESGEVFIHPRLLVEMLSKIDEEFITLSSDKSGLLKVAAGMFKCQINCLSSQSYPKPIIPFPEESVFMSGICSLAKRTTFLTGNDDRKPALQCVQVKFKGNAVHAAASDGNRMMLTKDSSEPTAEREFLLPGRSLKLLSSVSNDADVFEVGDIGNEVVFVRGDMIFSIRKLFIGNYMDINTVIKQLKPMYSALADVDKMKEALDIVSVAALAGGKRVPINLVLANGEIALRCNSDHGIASSKVPAKITTQDTPDAGFYYDVSMLLKFIQVVDSKVMLEIDPKGFMMIKTRNEAYIQAPMHPPVKQEIPIKPLTEKDSSQSEQGDKKQRRAKGAKEVKKDVA